MCGVPTSIMKTILIVLACILLGPPIAALAALCVAGLVWVLLMPNPAQMPAIVAAIVVGGVLYFRKT